MANETVKIDGPVKLASTGKEAVAFDLMALISNREYDNNKEKMRSRDYWLDLYHQCWEVVSGYPPKSSEK